MPAYDGSVIKSGSTLDLESLITQLTSKLPANVTPSLNPSSPLTSSNASPVYASMRQVSVPIEADEVVVFESFCAVSAATTGDKIAVRHNVNSVELTNYATHHEWLGSTDGEHATLYNKSITTDLSGTITFMLIWANLTAARAMHSQHQFLFVTRQKRRA